MTIQFLYPHDTNCYFYFVCIGPRKKNMKVLVSSCRRDEKTFFTQHDWEKNEN